MRRRIFVNLPVRDLVPSSSSPVSASSLTSNSQMKRVMPLTESKFRTFTPLEVRDATRSTEVLVAPSLESRGEIDDIVSKAVLGGGTANNEPKDYSFM